MIQPHEFRGNAYRKLADAHVWTQQVHEVALESGLRVVDAHHHLWDDQRGHYLIEELAEDIGTGHNIIATVFVETGLKYRADGLAALRPAGEVEFVDRIAGSGASGGQRTSQLCAGIVGHADLMLGDAVQPVLEALLAAGNGRLRGIRHSVSWDASTIRFNPRPRPQHLALDPTFRQGVARLQALGLSFDACTFFPQMPELVDLMRALPNANVILNHMGGLLGIPPHDKREEVFVTWRGYIRELAQFPNLTVKIGGLGSLYGGWDFHLREVPPSSEELAVAWRPYVETCIEAFGPGRCMMESNFPVDKQSCGYGVLWNALKRITQNCSAADKASLYCNTAAKTYRLAV